MCYEVAKQIGLLGSLKARAVGGGGWAAGPDGSAAFGRAVCSMLQVRNALAELYREACVASAHMMLASAVSPFL